MSYELDAWSRDLNTDFTLKDCLFGIVKLMDMVLDLILVHFFHIQVLIEVNCCYFWSRNS